MHSFCDARKILHVLPLQHVFSKHGKKLELYSNCSSFIILRTSFILIVEIATNGHLPIIKYMRFDSLRTSGMQILGGSTLWKLAACRYWRCGWDSGDTDKAIAVSIARVRWLFPLQRTGMIIIVIINNFFLCALHLFPPLRWPHPSASAVDGDEGFRLSAASSSRLWHSGSGPSHDGISPGRLMLRRSVSH
jgi:hypothetical protein